MSTATAAPQTSYTYASLGERRLARPLLSSLVIVGCDLATLTIVITTAVMLRHLLGAQYEIVVYLRLWPLLGLFLVAFASYGLYPGIVITPVSELRKTTEASTLVFVVLAAGTFVMRHRITYSRTVFFVAWLGVVLLIPLARSCVRHRAGRRDWWGYPVVIFGSGRIAEKIVFRLQQHPGHGLRPFAVLDETGAIGDISGVPLAGGFERAPEFARLGITHALIAMSDKVHWLSAAKIESEAKLFPNIIVVPDMPKMSSLLVETRDCCRMFTFQTRNNLLLRGPQLAKRIFDVLSAIVVGLLLLPLGILVSIAIWFDSPGPATYVQRRIGRGGKPFFLRKFRTMVTNADDLLFAYLRSHPAAADEWKRDHKLRDDPRVTRVGRILRRTSLDELPQLWNVFTGDMSLVGPRPIVEAEINKYGDDFLLYTQVVPGLTGMWQVSGRNNTSYEDRVELDSYYVRNWSPWLDVYLLARTLPVVFKGEGAY